MYALYLNLSSCVQNTGPTRPIRFGTHSARLNVSSIQINKLTAQLACLVLSLFSDIESTPTSRLLLNALSYIQFDAVGFARWRLAFISHEFTRLIMILIIGYTEHLTCSNFHTRAVFVNISYFIIKKQLLLLLLLFRKNGCC